MTQITHEELQHIAKLSAITITKEDEEKLLPQLEKIVTFVEKLNECDVSWIEKQGSDSSMACNNWLNDWIEREDFLKNVDHPTDTWMILLDVSTNE